MLVCIRCRILSHVMMQYDNPGVQTEIRGVIRYGVENDTMPDDALLDNPPTLPSGSPSELDTDDLVPAGGGPAPNSTLSVCYALPQNTWTKSYHSSFYFTISMQYASGPNYLSHFLSFINSTVSTPFSSHLRAAHTSTPSPGSPSRRPARCMSTSGTTPPTGLRRSQTHSSSRP